MNLRIDINMPIMITYHFSALFKRKQSIISLKVYNLMILQITTKLNNNRINFLIKI